MKRLFLVLISSLTAQRSTMSCPKLEPRPTPPQSIHDLRIDDIKVISAIGDSITAGFGADGLDDPTKPFQLSTLEENRGLSWAIGGDVGAVTLGNFIKTYSPNLVGQSVGSHIANLCYGLICPPFQYRPELDRFNAARSGSMVINLKDQVKWVRDQMKMNRFVNFKNDYKLMTLFIGSNDACIGCLPIIGQTVMSPNDFEKNIREVLEEIRTIPRIVVSIYQQFNVSQVFDQTNPVPYCKNLRKYGLSIECSCAFQDNKLGEKTREIMDWLVTEYNSRLEKIVQDYSKRNDYSFKVILDPILAGVALKDWSVDYVSNVDCFHPSKKSHELMAIGAWNNLFVPFAKKKRAVTSDMKVECPTIDSRIQ